ncbi:universal stress protein [Oceanibium sediminis]|uniref:universal stress protein n=1 Tax=Oceanibium sediminis TaxID=2026339 RepID=UPI000DD4257E|nr:universal stress protein [Oceanibium sediminis]
MFKHILVPYDGSKNAMAALEKAIELSDAVGAKITILTVYRHHSLLEASFSMVRKDTPEPIDDAMRDYAKELCEQAKARAKELGAENVRAVVKNGPVARGIVSFAETNEVDLIVMGGRGLGSVESYLLGSVSHKVTGISDCPVMIV